MNWTDYKSARHGSYSRATHTAAYDRAAHRGFSMSALSAGAGSGSIQAEAAEAENEDVFVLLRSVQRSLIFCF